MNETKLWQLRAGLITESDYQNSMEEDLQGTSVQTVGTQLKGIGVSDKRVQTALNKIKTDATLNTSDNEALAGVVAAMLKTNDDKALMKLFNTFKNIGGKEEPKGQVAPQAKI